MNNNNITKSNALIQASYQLTLNEQRIILYALSKINPKSDKFEKKVCIDVTEFAKQFLIKKDEAYRAIKLSINNLYDRTIKLENKDDVEEFRFIQLKKYYKNESKAEIVFSDPILKFIYNLNSCYTKYKIKHVAQFKSIYSFRFYELLTQYANTSSKSRKILIRDLKFFLKLEDKYKRWDLFKRHVLDVAKKEINELSDLKIDYKIERLNKKANALIFSISKTEKIEENKRNVISNNEKRNLAIRL